MRFINIFITFNMFMLVGCLVVYLVLSFIAWDFLNINLDNMMGFRIIETLIFFASIAIWIDTEDSVI